MRKTSLCLIVLATALVVACQAPIGNPFDSDTGTLVLHLSPGGLVARTIAPTLDMKPASYNVYGSGPGGATFEQLGLSSSTLTQPGLVLGTWAITVDGLNADGDVIGSGTELVQMNPGEVLSLTVPVVPIDGSGTLDVEVTWPDNVLASPAVTASLTAAGEAASVIDFVIDAVDSSAVYMNDTLDNGYYTIAITLSDAGVTVWSTVESVRIIAGQVSAKVFELVEDVNRAGFDLEVEPELDNPVEMTFNVGDEAAVTLGTDILVVAETQPADPMDGSYIYQWYLAGTALTDADSAVSVGSDLPVGVHWLDLVLTTTTVNGSVISSGRVKLNVGLSGGSTATGINGDVIVIAPPGALDTGITLSVETVDSVSLPANLGIVAKKVFDIKPSSVNFAIDGELIIRYRDFELPSGINPDQLVIINERPDGVWEESGGTVDTDRSRVLMPLSHTGRYALAVKVSEVEIIAVDTTPLMGEEQTVGAILKDAAGLVIVDRPVLWSSDDEGIFVVDAVSGELSADNRGSAILSAVSGDAIGSVEIVVHVYVFDIQVTRIFFDPYRDFDDGTDEYVVRNISVYVDSSRIGYFTSIKRDGNASSFFNLGYSTSIAASRPEGSVVRMTASAYEEDGGLFDPHDEMGSATGGGRSINRDTLDFLEGNQMVLASNSNYGVGGEIDVTMRKVP